MRRQLFTTSCNFQTKTKESGVCIGAVCTNGLDRLTEQGQDQPHPRPPPIHNPPFADHCNKHIGYIIKGLFRFSQPQSKSLFMNVV